MAPIRSVETTSEASGIFPFKSDDKLSETREAGGSSFQVSSSIKPLVPSIGQQLRFTFHLKSNSIGNPYVYIHNNNN